MTRLRNVVLVLLAGAIGAGVGLLVEYFAGLRQLPPVGAGRLPYPHVVPKIEDGAALRFAMVHDVLHERFPRHGRAYYQERNRRCRAALAERRDRPAADSFGLLDDLAVGLDMVGEHDEAIRLLRDKLRRQEELDVPARQRYSTHANLGTLLILGPFRQVRPGNEQDKEVLREGLKHIRSAIAINPDSHFGREAWQAALIEYMIALHDDPGLLLRFDFVGNRLDRDLGDQERSPLADFDTPPGSAGPLRWGSRYGGVAIARKAAEYLEDPTTWEQIKGNGESRGVFGGVRAGVARVGAEDGWAEAVPAGHTRLVPFDEPTLAIVGMWRLGGGAHPYFAIALGETMLRVGQNYLAWSAFERAARLADLAWPDKGLQQQFADHCRRRQAALEATLPAGEAGRLRPAFDTELALGRDYQQAYQRYEEEAIAAGRSIEDPHFHDAFHAGRPPIATPVGDADWFLVGGPWTPSWTMAAAWLLAGVFALLAAAWLPRPTTPTLSSRTP